MTNSATLVHYAKPEKPKLAFKNSHSELGAFSDVLVHQAKDNANNVVGAGNLTGDSLWIVGQLAQGIADPVMLVASAINASARLPLLLSDKTKQATTQDHLKDTTALSTAKDEHEQSIAEHIQHKAEKALDPTRHPVETSALIAMISGTIFLGLGLDNLISGEANDITMGILQMVIGVMSIGGRMLEIFSNTHSEKSAQSPEEAEAEKSFFGGIWQAMKDNPEVVSGTIGLISSASALGIGLASGSALMTIAGAVWIGSCIMYMSFVRRERDGEEQEQTQENETTARHTASREDKPVLGKFTAKLKEEMSGPSLEPSRA